MKLHEICQNETSENFHQLFCHELRYFHKFTETVFIAIINISDRKF